MSVADGTGSVDDSLVVRLDAVQSSLDMLEAEISKENDLRAKRIQTNEDAIAGQRKVTRRAMFIAAVAVLVAVIAVLGSLKANTAATDAKDALAASKAATADARLGSCLQYNDQQEKATASDKREFRKLVSSLAPNPSPETQARIDEFFNDPKDGFDVTAAFGHPLRDCTPRGIEQYLAKQKPPKP